MPVSEGAMGGALRWAAGLEAREEAEEAERLTVEGVRPESSEFSSWEVLDNRGGEEMRLIVSLPGESLEDVSLEEDVALKVW